jgi:L-asparaginase
VLDEAVAAWADAGGARDRGGGGGVSAGARRAAEEKGVVFATTQRLRSSGNNLVPQKARLLLLLSLAFSDDREQVNAWVSEFSQLEFEVLTPGEGATGGG